MKKLAILLFISLGLMLLAGCGAGNDPDDAKDSASSDSVYDVSGDTLDISGFSESDAASSSWADDEPVIPKPSGNTVEITEKLFLAQLNDIYLNPEDYLGKTIKYEGMFTWYTWEDNNMTYYMVYRQSPGCCGADGQAGFEVIWPEGSDEPYPEENDWCEAAGILEEYYEDDQRYLRLELTSLEVKEERGAEFVSQ